VLVNIYQTTRCHVPEYVCLKVRRSLEIQIKGLHARVPEKGAYICTK